jgi:hypothetical protein
VGRTPVLARRRVSVCIYWEARSDGIAIASQPAVGDLHNSYKIMIQSGWAGWGRAR